MNEDSAAANTEDITPVVDQQEPDYASPNDLDYEMSAEEEQSYVDQVLGKPFETPEVEPVEPEVVPVEPVAPVEPVVTEPVAPETVEEVTENPTPKTDDLYIEVDKVIEDDLGEKTIEKVKLIYDPNDPTSFIPEDFTATSTKQLAEILEAKAEMAALYKERQEAYETVETEKSTKEATEKAQNEQLASWDLEIAQLIEAGAIPKPKLKEGDKGFLDDPSVKLTDEVFQFMTKTNAERVTNGEKPILSFGTMFTLYQRDAERVAAAEAKKQENATAKAKGAMVGGASAASSGTEKSPYVAGSARNIWDVKV